MPARGEKGIAALEFALILPVLLVMVFAIIDVGRLIQARLVITNVSREGGSLASRNKDMSDKDLFDMLQASGSPLDLTGSGRIYISRIHAGTKVGPGNILLPVIDSQSQAGSLDANSSINSNFPYLGLSWDLYKHLVFHDDSRQTSDISEITVVEVYYQYTFITPLPKFIFGGILKNNIGSKAVF